MTLERVRTLLVVAALAAGVLSVSGSVATADGHPAIRVEGGDASLREALGTVAASGSEDTEGIARTRRGLFDVLTRAGYWSARVRGPSPPNAGEPVWTVTTGPIWSLSRAEIRTEGGAPPLEGWTREAGRVEAALKGLSPPQRGPLEQAASRLLAYWEERGYPFARVTPRPSGWPGDGIGSLDLVFDVESGPSVVVSEVDFEGDHKSRSGYLERIVRLPGGGEALPYRESFWLDGERRLRASGHFTSVSPPRLEILDISGDSTVTARVVYELTEGVSNQLEAAVGYSGQSRTLSGLVHVSLGNLWGTGRAFSLRWERRSAERTRFNLRYEEPYLWKLPLRWQVEIRHELEDTLYTRTDLRGLVSWEIEESLWLDLGLRSERSVVPEAFGGGRTRTSSLFGLRWDGLGRSREREKGWAASILWSRGTTSTGEGEGLRESVNEVESSGEIRQPLPVAGSGRLRFLGAGRFLDEPVPLFETYGVGGASTLRGYREEEFRVLRYGILQLEAGPHLGPGGSRLFLFVDAGWLLRWEREGSPVQGRKGPTHLRGSYGVGLRSLTRRGLIRIDYGVPWGDQPTSGRLHVALEAPF